MRLDKYLWSVRIFKTRTLAAEAIKGGKVKHNNDACKPSKEAKAGEEYSVQIGELNRTLKVLDFPKGRVAASAVTQYLCDLTPEEEYRSIALLKKHRFVQRPRGSGRPTKKERRDIEEWFGPPDA
jgi:ribosome-associated heat shock protein Hsp15